MTRRTVVVTIAHGRHDHLARQVRSLASGSQRAGQVLVAMADPALAAWGRRAGLHVVDLDADPAALPLAAARNTGARAALEQGADTVVFLDVDCLAGTDLVAGYADVVARQPGTIWSGPVTYLPPGLTEEQLRAPELLDAPHRARPAPAPGQVLPGADPDLFWSLSFAVDATAWDLVGGFCEDYTGYGGEDTDFARQALAQGIGLGWTGTARAYHQHHPTQEPPVQHLDAILRNGALFAERWGTWPMAGWLQAFEERGLVERTAAGWQRA